MSPFKYLVVTFQVWVSKSFGMHKLFRQTYRFIVLIKVIHISVEDLNKKLNRCCRFHARVRYTKSAL